jgi:hypothetical protein
MGAGTNIQERLHTIIHLDIPLRPRDMEQRLGRIDRQGNNWSKVDEVVLVQQGSLDSGLLHLNEIKAGFIGKILSGNDKSRSIEDPLLKESIQLKNDIKDLKLQEEIFRNNFNISSREINILETKILQNDNIISALKEYKIPPKEQLKYNEKNLIGTLKLEVDGKNLSDNKETFKDFRKIVEEKLINKTISQMDKGNVFETLGVRCQNIDFEIKAQGMFGKLQSLEVSFNANGQEIRNRLNSNASGQTIVDKLLETPNEKVVEKINYLENQNQISKSELEIHQKKIEVKEFPHKKDITSKENRLDTVLKEISQQQNLAKKEYDKHIASLKEKGIEISKIHWEHIEHQPEEKIPSNIDIDKERQSMINLAGSRLVDGKSMPELKETNSFKTTEKPYLKDKNQAIIFPSIETVKVKEEPKKIEIGDMEETKQTNEVAKETSGNLNLFGEEVAEKQRKRKHSMVEKIKIPREVRKEAVKQEQSSLFTTAPKEPLNPVKPEWMKMNDPRFEKVVCFGDRTNNVNRIYLLVETSESETQVVVPNGSGTRNVVATLKDIPVEKMKSLIENQYEDLMAGKAFVYEKEKTDKNPIIKDDDDGLSL